MQNILQIIGYLYLLRYSEVVLFAGAMLADLLSLYHDLGESVELDEAVSKKDNWRQDPVKQVPYNRDSFLNSWLCQPHYKMYLDH